jgi:acetylglutamate kinase
MNIAFLRSLVEQNIVPVFCAITHDEQGSLLNSNADSVASAVAVGASQIEPTNLIFCLEKNGVLTDVDDDRSVIPSINRESFAALRADGTINKGMIPKIEGAFRAIDGGVACVVIKHADNLDNDLETRIVEGL